MPGADSKLPDQKEADTTRCEDINANKLFPAEKGKEIFGGAGKKKPRQTVSSSNVNPGKNASDNTNDKLTVSVVPTGGKGSRKGSSTKSKADKKSCAGKTSVIHPNAGNAGPSSSAKIFGNVNQTSVVVLSETVIPKDTVVTPKSHCLSCDKADTSDMVQCDLCDAWFHFLCVDVTGGIAEKDWICERCEIVQDPVIVIPEEAATGGEMIPVDNIRTTKAKSKTSKASSIKRRELELLKNEEARKLKTKFALRRLELLEKLELEQLDDKFDELLDEIDDSEEEEDEEDDCSEMTDPRITEWLAHVKGFQERTDSQRGQQQVEGSGKAARLQVQNRGRSFALAAVNSEHAGRVSDLGRQIDSGTPAFSGGLGHAGRSDGSLVQHPSGAHSVEPAHDFVPGQRSTPNQRTGQQRLGLQTADLEPDSFVLNRSQLAARQAVSKEIPEFSGDPEDWPLFFSIFNSSTQMCGFTNEENMLRLRRCLKGRALEAVRCRLLHPSNVAGVMATLKMLFGKPEAIIHAVTIKIRSLPPPDINKLDTLVNFALSVENLRAIIEACEVEDFMYNASLRYELIEKLPPSLKLDWAKHARGLQSPKLSDFSSWLYLMAEDASSVLMTAPSYVKPRGGKNENKFINVHSDTQSSPELSSTNLTIQQYSASSSAKECGVCRGCCTTAAKCKRFDELSYESKWAVVKELHLCRKCLRRHNGSCRQYKECGRDGCKFKHHPLLHNFHQQQQSSVVHSQSLTLPETERNCNLHQTQSNDVLFRIVPVTLHGPNKEVQTHAFLDDGSELTLIEKELADQLHLEGPLKPLCLKWTGGTRRFEYNSRKVKLDISAVGKGNNKHRLTDVRTVEELRLPQQTLIVEELKAKYSHLDGLPIESYRNAIPRILIGLDHTHLGHALNSREGAPNEPVAVKTRLGWNVYGRCSGNQPTSHFVNHHSFHAGQCDCASDESLHRAMKEYFSLDSMGVTKAESNLLSAEDQRAQEMLKSLTCQKDGRYETGILWKYGDVRLPDNKAMAMRRWKCLEQRLSKDQALASVLDGKIKEYLDKKYIRKLTTEELAAYHPRTWYLPIFPVINPNKPGKIRIVWDAAAKAHGVSLNSVLMKGPDQLTSLPSVLHKFREFRVGISGDIREMFHQVLIREEDQHCQRFFWKDDQSKTEPNVFLMRVMTFGASCSPSSAQYVKNHNAMKYDKQYPVAANAIVRKHYVDDMLASVETEDEAISLARDVKLVHSQGGFEMRNWISNSSRVIAALREENTKEKDLNLTSELATEKVLGMFWCTSTDTFTYKLSDRHDPELLSGLRVPSKREVLRTLMMVFDPLGLIAHVLMFLKVLLQDIWRSGIGWDDQIDEGSFKKWLRWLNVLPLVEQIHIPPCFRSLTSVSDENKVQMHVFVDASEGGFAAAVYLRFEQDGKVECVLVAAKTRVAPLKYLSIPRLELQAGVLGVRLAANVTASLTIKISRCFYWTDSRNLLCWLRADHMRYSQYVGCRIGEIRESTEVGDWRWVPTKDNVADDGTKWQRKPDVSTNSRWFKGPSFLHEAEEEWPIMTFPIGSTDEELRPHLLAHFAVPEKVIDDAKFSSWMRLYRVTAFVLRAIEKFRKATENRPRGTARRLKRVDDVEPLLQHELVKAQNFLYRQAQMSTYPDELALLRDQSSLSSSKQIPKSSSLFRESPYLDDQSVMRIHGRIGACLYTDLEAKNPVILPPAHHTTHLIVQHFHCNLLHRNHETAINKIRLRYYIPRLRVVYRKLRGNCQRCKIESAIPCPPSMGDLPEARLAAFTRPFSYVGVDYFGPMMVSVGRRVEKRWGVLITCLTIRAIHIEIAHSLSTDSCIMALRCFMARRGAPIIIYSDRGTNFQGASKELPMELEKMNQEKLVAEIVSAHTAWKFIPPVSPHMGGAWERLIQTVKKNLTQMQLPRLPSDEVLRNALVEIENTVNSRPLTHVPVDDESAPVLTPNHFLLGSSDGLKPLAPYDDSSAAVKKCWQLSQTMANIFWRHWLTYYLPTLTRRTKWFSAVKPLGVGDIVVIVDPKSPRNTWPKGKVIATSYAKDGQVRWATIQTAGGIYERPAVKLAVLDIGVSSSSPQVDLRRTPGGSVICATSSATPFGADEAGRSEK